MVDERARFCALSSQVMAPEQLFDGIFLDYPEEWDAAGNGERYKVEYGAMDDYFDPNKQASDPANNVCSFPFFLQERRRLPAYPPTCCHCNVYPGRVLGRKAWIVSHQFLDRMGLLDSLLELLLACACHQVLHRTVRVSVLNGESEEPVEVLESIVPQRMFTLQVEDFSLWRCPGLRRNGFQVVQEKGVEY
jgi:hypothetical protein